jgi:hypothetical protein
MKEFTDREFNSFETEVMRVARDITNKTIYSCSVMLMDNAFIIDIFDNNNAVYCSVHFYKSRFFSPKEFRKLSNIEMIFSPKIKFGKYLRRVNQAFMDTKGDPEYIEF